MVRPHIIDGLFPNVRLITCSSSLRAPMEARRSRDGIFWIAMGDI